jgi:6-phosphogluconolactonase/glucosamine-6-phosphate isomerase/deaminase
MEVYRYKSSQEAKSMAAKQVSRFLQEAHAVPTLLLLSGGSSLAMADEVNVSQLGKHVTIGMLDERHSIDPSVNNFAQFSGRKLYQQGKAKEVQYIDTRVILKDIHGQEVPETLEELTERMQKELRDWRAKNPKGRVVITQGIGEDGHTAGIMPHVFDRHRFEGRFENEAEWVVGYDTAERPRRGAESFAAPKEAHVFAGNPTPFSGKSSLFGSQDPLVGVVKAFWAARSSAAGHGYPLRVTVTFPFLREIVDHAVVYAVGRNKRAALERVLLERKRIWEIPARIIHQMKDVTVFTDLE